MRVEFDLSVRLNQELRAEMEKHFKLHGQMKKVPGHKLWEFDTAEMILREVAPNTEVVVDSQNNKIKRRHKVHEKKGCIYFQALRRESALKKIEKFLKAIHNTP